MKIPIDNISFYFKIIRNKEAEKFEVEKKPPENGCYIYGLYIEGARWNYLENVLDDPRPGQIYSSMPIIWFMPCKRYLNSIRKSFSQMY